MQSKSTRGQHEVINAAPSVKTQDSTHKSHASQPIHYLFCPYLFSVCFVPCIIGDVNCPTALSLNMKWYRYGKAGVMQSLANKTN